MGRATYFASAHLLQPAPSPWIAVEQEAPDARVFKIPKSGLAWPTSMVNMRTPQIFERFLLRYGVSPANHAAMVQGVAASGTMAIDLTSGSSVIQRYPGHSPSSADPRLPDLWAQLANMFIEAAVNRYQPLLRAHERIDEVFRYQDLEAHAARLERSTVASL